MLLFRRASTRGRTGPLGMPKTQRTPASSSIFTTSSALFIKRAPGRTFPKWYSGAEMAEGSAAPDSTAVRVALWRAMHVQVDPPPHVLEDEIGLRLAAPAEGWRRRGDMDPRGTSRFRAGIVARARFAEDLVVEQAGRGVCQYVILGAGL